MKCSSCNHEFGNGDYCAHCGVDRVTGLGHYSGYNAPTSSVPTADTRTQSTTDFASNDGGDQQSICWHCGEIIPKGAKYCPFCATLLIVRCPNCGLEYSSRYPVCSNCGTNREEYEERKRKEIEEKEKSLKQEEAEKHLQIEQNRTKVLKYIYKNQKQLKKMKKKSESRGLVSTIMMICAIPVLIISTACINENEVLYIGLISLSLIILVIAIIVGVSNARETPQSDFISQMEKDLGGILIPREEVIKAINSAIEEK